MYKELVLFNMIIHRSSQCTCTIYTYVSAITHPTLNLSIHYLLFFRSIDYTAGRIFLFFILHIDFVPTYNEYTCGGPISIDLAQATEKKHVLDNACRGLVKQRHRI